MTLWDYYIFPLVSNLRINTTAMRLQTPDVVPTTALIWQFGRFYKPYKVVSLQILVQNMIWTIEEKDENRICYPITKSNCDF